MARGVPVDQLPPDVRRRIAGDQGKRTRREVPAAECLPVMCASCGQVVDPPTDAAMRRHEKTHAPAGTRWEVVIDG